MFLTVCLFFLMFLSFSKSAAAEELVTDGLESLGICSGLDIIECRVKLSCGLEKSSSPDAFSPSVSVLDYSICPEDRSARLFYLMFKNFFDSVLTVSDENKAELSETIIKNKSSLHKVEPSKDLELLGKINVFDYYSPGLVQSFNGVHNVYNQISFEYMFYYITHIIYLISIGFILFAVFVHAVNLKSAGMQQGSFLGKKTGLNIISKYISAFILLTPLNFVNITSIGYDTVSSDNFLVVHFVVLLLVFFGIGIANLLYGAIISVYSAPIEPVVQMESKNSSDSEISEKVNQNKKVYSSALLGSRQRELYKKADEFALVFVKEALCRRNELIKNIDDTRVEERKKGIINQFVENKLNRIVKFSNDAAHSTDEVKLPVSISSGSKTSLRPLTYDTASNKSFDYSKAALGSFHCAKYKINYKTSDLRKYDIKPVLSSVEEDLAKISKVPLSKLPNVLYRIANDKKDNPYEAYGIGSLKPRTDKEIEEDLTSGRVVRSDNTIIKQFANEVKACIFDNKPPEELFDIERLHSISLMQYALLGQGIGTLSNERSQASQDINNMALDIAENLVGEVCRSDIAPGQKKDDAMNIAIKKDYSFGKKSFCTNLLTAQSGEIKDYHPVDPIFKEEPSAAEEKTYSLPPGKKMTAALYGYQSLRDAIYQVLLGIDEQKVNIFKINHVKAENEVFGVNIDKNSRSICYRQKGWLSLPNYLLSSDSDEADYRLMNTIHASEIEPLSVFKVGDLINPSTPGYLDTTFDMKNTLSKMRDKDNFPLSAGKIYTLKEQDYFISRMSQKDIGKLDVNSHSLLPFDYNQIRGAADGRHALFKLQDISKKSIDTITYLLGWYLGIAASKGAWSALEKFSFISQAMHEFLWKVSSTVAYLMHFILFIYVLTAFLFGYILPILPIFLFVLAFMAWFITVFQILLVAPLWVAFFVQYALAKGNDDQQIRHTLLVSLLQVSLRPFLLVLGFLVAWLIFDFAFIPFEYLFNDIFTTVNDDFSKYNPVKYILLIAYLLMMFMIIFKLVEFSFETIDNLARRMLQLLNVQGYDSSTAGNFISQAAIQMAAVSVVAEPLKKIGSGAVDKAEREGAIESKRYKGIEDQIIEEHKNQDSEFNDRLKNYEHSKPRIGVNDDK